MSSDALGIQEEPLHSWKTEILAYFPQLHLVRDPSCSYSHYPHSKTEAFYYCPDSVDQGNHPGNYANVRLELLLVLLPATCFHRLLRILPTKKFRNPDPDVLPHWKVVTARILAGNCDERQFYSYPLQPNMQLVHHRAIPSLDFLLSLSIPPYVVQAEAAETKGSNFLLHQRRITHSTTCGRSRQNSTGILHCNIYRRTRIYKKKIIPTSVIASDSYCQPDDRHSRISKSTQKHKIEAKRSHTIPRTSTMECRTG